MEMEWSIPCAGEVGVEDGEPLCWGECERGCSTVQSRCFVIRAVDVGLFVLRQSKRTGTGTAAHRLTSTSRSSARVIRHTNDAGELSSLAYPTPSYQRQRPLLARGK